MIAIYGHPLAAYCWKVSIALYERALPFEFRMVDVDHPENVAAVGRHGPTGQFPVLVDGDRVVIETAPIIEYLDLHHGAAAPMVPANPRAAIEARQMDGVFDDYVMAPLQRMVFAVLRKERERDPHVEGEVKAALDRSYAWLDRWMTGRHWTGHGSFSIADCAAAPALFYAHWAFPIPQSHENLCAYRKRLLARPSIARVIDEARPWFGNFPLKDRGSPD